MSTIRTRSVLIGIFSLSFFIGPILSYAAVMPDYDRPIVFKGNLVPQNAQSQVIQHIADLQLAIQDNPRSPGAWNELGIYWQMIGDYEGARQSWAYAAQLKPHSFVPYFNLGGLYQYYLKDFPQARKAYKSALALNPQYAPTYTALYDLYSHSYLQQSNLAHDILVLGVQRNPRDIVLLTTLGEYDAAHNDSADAKTYYTQAFSVVQSLGDATTAAMLQAKIKNL